MLRPLISAVVPAAAAVALRISDPLTVALFVVVAVVVGIFLRNRGPFAQALVIFGVLTAILLSLLIAALLLGGRVTVEGGDFTTSLAVAIAFFGVMSLGYGVVYKLLEKWF